MKVQAYAATSPKGALSPFEYELGPLPVDEVDIEVHYCGICHSDICLLYTSPSPRDGLLSRMPSSA